MDLHYVSPALSQRWHKSSQKGQTPKYTLVLNIPASNMEEIPVVQGLVQNLSQAINSSHSLSREPV